MNKSFPAVFQFLYYSIYKESKEIQSDLFSWCNSAPGMIVTYL